MSSDSVVDGDEVAELLGDVPDLDERDGVRDRLHGANFRRHGGFPAPSPAIYVVPRRHARMALPASPAGLERFCHSRVTTRCTFWS